MNEIEQKYKTLRNELPPKGIKQLVEDLYIRLDLYSDEILGLSLSYVKGIKIDPDDVKIDEELSMRLEASLEKLNEFIIYKNKVDELAILLRERITSEKKE